MSRPFQSDGAVLPVSSREATVIFQLRWL